MTFLTGIIEGFYGREWSWEARHSYAPFLQQTGLNSYLYCPKGDTYLRKKWWQAWPAEAQQHLQSLAADYRQRGLNWGMGLSPYALYQDYSGTSRQRLRDKVSAIDAVGGNLLAILFDDMPGDCADLAARQAEILADVLHWSNCDHLLVCPTYYSFDPQLERYFGAMPQNYWSELGSQLAPQCQIMWTGNQVCSATITAADITAIRDQLGRKPILWDNYPVNDGKQASNFLYLTPLPGRDGALAEQVSGHFCNPMNQALLSRYPLAGLAHLYGGRTARAEDFFSAALCRQLHADQSRFEQQGLAEIPIPEREKLATLYDKLAEPAASEIADWLRGGYRFDPACLTN